MRRRRGTSRKRMMNEKHLYIQRLALVVESGGVGRVRLGGSCARSCTYRHMILKIMTRPKWKMFAMPSAKQRIMHNMPIHCP